MKTSNITLFRKLNRNNSLNLIFLFTFLFIFFYFPLLNILREAFTNNIGNFSFYQFASVFKDNYNLRVILFTFKEAFISALFTLIIGLPGAYIISHYKFKGKSFLVSISTVPFVLPSLLVALGFIILFGDNGLINKVLMNLFNLQEPVHILYSFAAIILVHTFYNFPIVLRIIGSSWEGISDKYEYAARSLGANPFKVFYKIILPMLLPAIISSFSLVFLFCFLSFSIILIIGGAKFATIEVSIYMYYNIFSNFKMGSALATFQAFFSLFVIYIYLKINNIFKTGSVKKSITEVPDISKYKRTLILSIAYLCIIFCLIIAPVLVVIFYAFVDPISSKLTLGNFKSLFGTNYTYLLGTSFLKVVSNSFLFAMFTLLIANFLALIGSYGLKRNFKGKNFIISVLMLPLAISPITIALSFIVSFRSPINLLITPLPILIAHILVAFPFAVRSILPAVESTSDSFVFAARSLGLSRIRSFLKIDLNLLKNVLITSSIFSFAISFGEFGATFMLYMPKFTTIPIALYRLLAGRHYGAASALGSIFAIINIVAFILIEKFHRERINFI
jgi:thiamine transport system permease protein